MSALYVVKKDQCWLTPSRAWTFDQTAAYHWKVKIDAEQAASVHGGEVWQIGFIEADIQTLPRQALVYELESTRAALDEVHQRLDNAGVPTAFGVACADPNCQTKAGHRVHGLVVMLESSRAEIDRLRAALHEYGAHHEECCSQHPNHFARCDCGWTELGIEERKEP